jgi:hypothetical protein
MRPDKRVRILDRLSPHYATTRPAELSLLKAGVNSCKTMETFLQGW